MKIRYLASLITLAFIASCNFSEDDGHKDNKLKDPQNDILSKASYYNQLFANTSADSSDMRYRYAYAAYEEAEKTKDHQSKIQAMINIAISYNHQYRYDNAMQWLLKAKTLTEPLDFAKEKALVLNQIGQLYLDMRNLELAHEYFTKALGIEGGFDDKSSQASAINGLALTHWLQGQLDTALIYLFETLRIGESIGNSKSISRACNNIGIVYHEKKEYNNALEYLFRALELCERRNDLWSTAEACNNIGENYISMGKYTEAERYLAKAREIAIKIKAYLLLEDNYRYMSRMMKQTGNYQKALEYYEKFHHLDDSLFNRNKYTIISELKSSFEIEKKEQEINLQKEKIDFLEEKKRFDNMQKMILLAFIFIILSAGFLVYNRQKKINQRNRMLLEKDKQIQKAQALLMEKEKNEKDRLANELEQTNKFLIDFALYIGMKNEFLAKIKEELKDIARNKDKSPEIRQIIQQVNQNLRVNREFVDLQKKVEQTNHEFLQKLSSQYSDLTENDKQLAILLRLNFSSKEIADLRAVSNKAIEMSRYRLRKRFNLDKHESLTQFLKNI
jgi:tetratricopeptide (TPR) repeat protein